MVCGKVAWCYRSILQFKQDWGFVYLGAQTSIYHIRQVHKAHKETILEKGEVRFPWIWAYEPVVQVEYVRLTHGYHRWFMRGS